MDAFFFVDLAIEIICAVAMSVEKIPGMRLSITIPFSINNLDMPRVTFLKNAYKNKIKLDFLIKIRYNNI
jgi:hypothetical protein